MAVQIGDEIISNEELIKRAKILDPERELWGGLRRLLLSAAKMIEIYLERRDRLK